jgi:DNA-binding transcriptional LysR family regulator
MFADDMEAAMSIRGLRALKAVAEYCSFANASKALNVTPSALSMQISSLEAALGMTLFDRGHRPPRLTRAGEEVRRYAASIVDQYDGMLAQIAETSFQRDYFRLGVIPTALSGIGIELLVYLRANHPDLVVSVTTNLSGDLARMVVDGEVDGALMHMPTLIDAEFEWRDACKQSVVILAPPDSTETELNELFDSHPYIRFNRSAWIAPLIEERLDKLGISPNTAAEVESVEAIQKMVELGFGISAVPDTRTRKSTDGPYRILDFGPDPIFRTIGVLSRKSLHKKRARDVICHALDDLLADSR